MIEVRIHDQDFVFEPLLDAHEVVTLRWMRLFGTMLSVRGGGGLIGTICGTCDARIAVVLGSSIDVQARAAPAVVFSFLRTRCFARASARARARRVGRRCAAAREGLPWAPPPIRARRRILLYRVHLL